MDFFTKNDFELLNNTVKKEGNKDEEDYKKLLEAERKTQYWANEVIKEIFPNGKVFIRKRPTNQKNIYKGYTWAQIFPDKNNKNELIYTVGINYEKYFIIKIDILRTKSSPTLEHEYENLRGDFYNSDIVKKLTIDQGLNMSFEQLITWSVNEIKNNLQPKYNTMLTKLKPYFSNTNICDTSISQELITTKKQIILCGPAGTGKTYNTKSIIVTHETNSFDLNSDEINKKYDELKKSGRVKFVTFHQSFAYEDFIEGIKPNLDNQNISYSIEDGIFKKSTINPIITDMARTEIQCNNVEESSRFWKISLGNSQISNEHERIYDYCVENNYIALGYGEEDTKNSMFKRFKDELKEGDYVFISKGNEKIKGFVKVTGEYEKIEEAPFQNCRKVEWLLHDLDEPVKNLFNKRFSQMSFYLLDINKPNINELNKILSGSINVEFSNNIIKDYLIDFYKKTKEDRKEFFKNSKPYYLIIDEINRGNISKIFGELITLLEASKRLGEADELTTTLPYSKEEFGIPPNLYIIGTMNTSDKSIAHLDVALRRRFSFVEMLPDYDPDVISDEKCRKLLETLNQRIEILLDKDHLIGHSFFMPKKDENNNDIPIDIGQIMQYEIVPLLEEYFYGDYEKIQQVLKNTGYELFESNIKIPEELKAYTSKEKLYKYWFEKTTEQNNDTTNN